jgi:hypothetical protein
LQKCRSALHERRTLTPPRCAPPPWAGLYEGAGATEGESDEEDEGKEEEEEEEEEEMRCRRRKTENDGRRASSCRSMSPEKDA